MKEISSNKEIERFEKVVTFDKLHKWTHVTAKFLSKEIPTGIENKENTIFLFGEAKLMQVKKQGKPSDKKAISSVSNTMELSLAMEKLTSSLELNLNNPNLIASSQSGDEVMVLDAVNEASPSH